MNKPIFYIFLIALIACRPAKKVQRLENVISKKDTSQMVIVTPKEDAVDSFSLVKSIIGNIEKQKIDFNTFTAKIKVAYEGKEGGDQGTAYVRIQKDSLIWISLTGPLGIEGIRVLINKDSVKLMNKLDKTVQYRSIAYLQEITKVPFGFNALQDLIIGRPLFIDSNIVSYKAANNDLLVLMSGDIFKHLITLENKDFKVVHSKLDDIDPMQNRTADITYEGYENVGNYFFSTKRKITVSEKSKLNIDLHFRSYNFDKAQNYPFNIPKNFKRK